MVIILILVTVIIGYFVYSILSKKETRVLSSDVKSKIDTSVKWGQIRTAIAAVAGAILGSQFGIYEIDINSALDAVGRVLTSAEGIIAEVALIWAAYNSAIDKYRNG